MLNLETFSEPAAPLRELNVIATGKRGATVAGDSIGRTTNMLLWEAIFSGQRDAPGSP